MKILNNSVSEIGMNKMLFDTEAETVKPPQLKNPSILQALGKSSWCLSLAVGVLCVRPAQILPTLGISWIISVCCSLSLTFPGTGEARMLREKILVATFTPTPNSDGRAVIIAHIIG